MEDDLREAVCALLAGDVELAVEWEQPASLYGDFDADRVAAMYEALIAAESRTTRILAGLDASPPRTSSRRSSARYEETAHEIITSARRDRRVRLRRGLAARRLPRRRARSATASLVEDGAVRRNERFEYQPA